MPSMVLAFLLALLVMGHNEDRNTIHVSLWACCFMLGLIMIYTMGIIDDLLGLDAKTKFFVQIIAATLLPLSGLYINHLYGFFGILAEFVQCYLKVFTSQRPICLPSLGEGLGVG